MYMIYKRSYMFLIVTILNFCFQRRDVYGAWEQYLGLEHPDNAPKRSYAANQVVTLEQRQVAMCIYIYIVTVKTY